MTCRRDSSRSAFAGRAFGTECRDVAFGAATQIELWDAGDQPNKISLLMLVVSTDDPEPEATDRLYIDRFSDERPSDGGIAPELDLPQYVRDR